MKPRAVVFDLDGTLASKKHSINTTVETWDDKKWAEGAAKAKPIPDMQAIWYKLGNTSAERIVLTARPESLREMTLAWLDFNLGFGRENDMLLMLPNVAKREENKLTNLQDIHDLQARYKVTKLNYLQKSYRIAMFYDDNETIIKEVNKLGVPTCLTQTAP